MTARRMVAAAMAAAALVSACGPEPRLRLSMRTVAVTVPRLVTPAVELLAPSPSPPVPLPPVPPVVSQLPALVPVVETPVAAAEEPGPACPPAGPFAVPRAAASETVELPPAEQVFVQRSTGSFKGAVEGGLDQPVQVTVTRLPATATATGQPVRPWRVQQIDTATQARSVALYQLLLPSPAPGASAPGVYLVGLAWSDPVRGELAFQPSGNGILVLPSPVAVAQNNTQYVGIATDPTTLTTLTLTRNVRGRKRVDACGELVDSWTVEMTGRLVAPGRQWNVTWTQQLATAYGPVAVEELLGLEDATGGLSWTRRLVSTSVPEETR